MRVAPAPPASGSSINLNGKTGARGNGDNVLMSQAPHLVERFTRTDAETLEYEVTIEDPNTWVRPRTVAHLLTLNPSYQILEYACHAGNYGLQNILTGARAKD